MKRRYSPMATGTDELCKMVQTLVNHGLRARVGLGTRSAEWFNFQFVVKLVPDAFAMCRVDELPPLTGRLHWRRFLDPIRTCEVSNNAVERTAARVC
eukprot:scaffold4510_cov183-Amphora_coffeaeformis.AAC.15